jgi:hypothetical protein
MNSKGMSLTKFRSTKCRDAKEGMYVHTCISQQTTGKNSDGRILETNFWEVALAYLNLILLVLSIFVQNICIATNFNTVLVIHVHTNVGK